MQEVKKNLIKGASILGVGAFLTKLIGAIYRIPLTNLLGGEGLGLYQMVFPVYCILLDFAGAGAPNAIAKIIAQKDREKGFAERTLFSCLKTFSKIGIICAILIAVFGYPLSYLQGNTDSFYGYLFLSPAVFFTALISCYRGYFQGKLNMNPTAVSQVIEQTAKLLLGILFVYLLRGNTILAVGGATFAVTLSEVIAFLYLKFRAARQGVKLYRPSDNQDVINKGELFRLVLPVTLVGILIPVSNLIESLLVVNIISRYRQDATALYGLYSGAAATVIHLPVALCYGIATAVIPSISSLKEKDKKKQTSFSLVLTFFFASAFALGVYFLCPIIVKMLFSSLSLGEKTVTVKMLKILAANVVLSSMVQTENAVFIARGKAYIPLITLSVGVIIKTVVEIILLANPSFNIYGGCIGTIACYFSASLVNLIILARSKEKDAVKKVKGGEYAY